MTKEEFKNATDGVIYLAGCAADGRVPDPERIAGWNMDDLFTVASGHLLAAAVGQALQSAGVENAAFSTAVAASYRKTVILDSERAALYQRLDEAGIWHMSLKGTVLKTWYPRFGMREMVDCDVLLDAERQADVKDIMVSLGFAVRMYGRGHHDIYYKKPLSNFELHMLLFGEDEDPRFYEYYVRVKDRLVPCGGAEFRFRPEDFYVFMLAHEYKHYVSGGAGLRSLLDTRVFLHKFSDSLDRDYIDGELRKLGLAEFEKTNRALALRVFSGEPLSEEERDALDYMIFSGGKGTLRNKIVHRVERDGGGLKGRLRYIGRRLFPPMRTVKRKFPLFYRHKILLPFLPAYRLIKKWRSRRWRIELRALFGSRKRGGPGGGTDA